jgi:hypothetical protein
MPGHGIKIPVRENPMRKVVFLSSAVLVVAALVFAGGDPWKSKPYQQWDAKDVQRVLEDSPWSKVIQVEATWKTGKDNSGNDASGPAVATNQQAPAGGGGGNGKAMGGSAPGAVSTPVAGAGDSGNSSGSASFLIRWVSSKTVEKAVYRKAELAGQMKPEDAEKELAKQLDVYELVVFGPDMKPFQSADEDMLKTDGYLIEKKTKQKISPMKVEITRAQDGTKVQAVGFIFLRKAANGEPTIADDEKSVDFICSVNGAKIHTTFDISKMQDTQGRDL